MARDRHELSEAIEWIGTSLDQAVALETIESIGNTSRGEADLRGEHSRSLGAAVVERAEQLKA